MSKTPVHIAGTDEEIAACFRVIRELRPHLKDAEDLLARVKRQRREGYGIGYIRDEAGSVVACIGFRRQERLAYGPLIYIDDLATLSSARSRGFGAALLDWVEALAQREGRKIIDLDSATHRLEAHRFYLRQRYAISSFHFLKKVAS